MFKKDFIKPTVLSLFVALVMASGVSFSDEAETQTKTNLSVANAVTSSGEDELDEVVVFGVRQALESAAAQKRLMTNIVEIINAEDVGKLPDENLAEVLENLPGIQIERNRGVGGEVSIRGVSENRVEIDGEDTTPAMGNRGGISFADLPANLVNSLHVVKVPTADMVEGSLGGTVRVNTQSPLKLQKAQKVFNLNSQYHGNAGEWGGDASFNFGDKWETERGDIGVSLILKAVDKTLRQDRFRSNPAVRRVDRNPNYDIDRPEDGISDTYIYPRYTESVYQTQDIENFTARGRFEWQQSYENMFFASGLVVDYAEFARDQQISTHPISTPHPENEGHDQATWNTVNINGVDIRMLGSGLLGAGNRGNTNFKDGYLLRTQSLGIERDTDTKQFTIGGERITDTYELNVSLNHSSSSTNEPRVVANMYYGDPAHQNFGLNLGTSAMVQSYIRTPMFFDMRNGTPALAPPEGAQGVTNVNSVSAATHDFASTITDPSYYSMFLFKELENFYENEILTQKVDFKWIVDEGPWDSVSVGMRASQRTSERERQQDIANYPGYTAAELQSELPGFMATTPSDFLAFNDDIPHMRNFLTADGNVMMANRETIRSLVNLDPMGTVDRLGYFKVQEDTLALYLRADFEFSLHDTIPIAGNIGFRYVNTDQKPEGKISNFIDGEAQLDDLCPDIDESGIEVVGSEVFCVNPFASEYSNFLPSFNLVIRPTETVQLRLGYAHILRRPSFNELTPTFAFPNNAFTAVTSGNSELEPTTAEQVDIAFEYYPRKGTSFTAGYFYKELDGTIGRFLEPAKFCNPREFDVLNETALRCSTGSSITDFDQISIAAYDEIAAGNQRGFIVDSLTFQNLGGGILQGIELAIQHRFKNLPDPFDGLGLNASYAIQKGTRSEDPNARLATAGFLTDERYNGGIDFRDDLMPFKGLSERSYNITLWYDKPRLGLSGRLRYTYRSPWLLTESTDAANNYSLYSDSRSYLSGTVTYKINSLVSVRLNGTNLTEEKIVHQQLNPGGPMVYYNHPGRVFTLGLTVKL